MVLPEKNYDELTSQFTFMIYLKKYPILDRDQDFFLFN